MKKKIGHDDLVGLNNKEMWDKNCEGLGLGGAEKYGEESKSLFTMIHNQLTLNLDNTQLFIEYKGTSYRVNTKILFGLLRKFRLIYKQENLKEKTD